MKSLYRSYQFISFSGVCSIKIRVDRLSNVYQRGGKDIFRAGTFMKSGRLIIFSNDFKSKGWAILNIVYEGVLL